MVSLLCTHTRFPLQKQHNQVLNCFFGVMNNCRHEPAYGCICDAYSNYTRCGGLMVSGDQSGRIWRARGLGADITHRGKLSVRVCDNGLMLTVCRVCCCSCFVSTKPVSTLHKTLCKLVACAFVPFLYYIVWMRHLARLTSIMIRMFWDAATTHIQQPIM